MDARLGAGEVDILSSDLSIGDGFWGYRDGEDAGTWGHGGKERFFLYDVVAANVLLSS